MKLRACAEQAFTEFGAGEEEVFAVVQDQQKLPGLEVVGESGLDRPPGLLSQI
jgi:hypothetical protein